MELFNIVDCPRDELVSTYAAVFAGPDWFEVEKCTACGKSYPGPVTSRLSDTYANGDQCWNSACDVPLQLASFYLDPEDQLAQKIVENALGQDRFVGAVAREGDQIVGFSWGYALPAQDTPSVRASELRALFDAEGFAPESLFYAAETGVIPDMQRSGVGERLVRTRLEQAARAGFSHAAFRTIDHVRLVGLWRKVLGENAVKQMFKDPDPAKDQIWYVGDLASLRAESV